jgi:predicted ester cyclase
MFTERNRESFMQALDRLNQGDLEGAVAFLAPDVILHERIPGLPPGRQGAKLHLQSWLQAFPDAQVSLHDLIAADDKVVGRLRWTGTHAGELLGRPPTGRSVSGDAVLISRWVGDKAVEIWLSADLTAPLHQ